MIKPIYKASADDTNPSNYRGITLLSCFFSNLIIHRLTLFVDNNNIIGPKQAGFRAGFSTTDHLFAIKTLIIINVKNYSAALSITATPLTVYPALSYGISCSNLIYRDFFFNLVHNMHKTAK